jgi:glucose/arabinose dehydrogenase
MPVRPALLAPLLLAFPATSACADRSAPGWVVEDVVSGLGPTTDVGFLPDGRMVITEKTGALRLRERDGRLRLAGMLPVDERSEKGLLGVVVDPDFARTRRLFLYVSLADSAGGTDLDRHRVLSVPLRADGTLDLSAQRVLLRGLRGPRNHDGGGLAIGPDGKLYVGVGDTGCNSNAPPEPVREPTNHFASCLGNANGKILRVDLDGAIPADNPLVGVAAATACAPTCGDALGTATATPRREIWAWGLRNPWRFAFDPRTGRLWVGDVGEITYEEIDVVERGRHYGWPWREGRHGWPRAKCREISPSSGDCVDPVYECRHGGAADGVDGECQSITGGVFLDGPSWPAPLRGLYLFGDNANGRIWTLTPNAARDGVIPGSRQEVARVQGMPVSFRTGPDGAVYVAILPGRVVRVGAR